MQIYTVVIHIFNLFIGTFDLIQLFNFTVISYTKCTIYTWFVKCDLHMSSYTLGHGVSKQPNLEVLQSHISQCEDAFSLRSGVSFSVFGEDVLISAAWMETGCSLMIPDCKKLNRDGVARGTQGQTRQHTLPSITITHTHTAAKVALWNTLTYSHSEQRIVGRLLWL